MLEIKNLHVKYDQVEVLHGIDMTVQSGEIVTLLGANGAGKSTTLMCISGLVRAYKGEILFCGKPIHRVPANKIVASGISQSPEGRRVFGTLTVLENLRLGAFTIKDKHQIASNMEWIFALFPRLSERKHQMAGTLSGGEQQMLAIGRSLMSNPKLLLLDEPGLGLAPILVQTIFQTIQQINKKGVTVLLVEQNALMALKLAHRGYVLEVGNVVLEDTAARLLCNDDVQSAYLGKQ
jgi:branched-chain amino acid transport system ATP-binding protein